jgi:hypothetical protein
MHTLNILLTTLCTDINFVRNVRVHLSMLPENEQAVRTLLKDHKYVVTDRDLRNGIVEIRAV